MRKLTYLLASSAVVVALLALVVEHLRQRELPDFLERDSAAAVGVFHVHSSLSHDSELSTDVIANAAKDAELDFVLLTDHNQQAAGPMERSGVTLLSSAELSTPFGHLIALGATQVLDKTRQGELAVHQHIASLGGLAIAAHPSDLKRPWEGPLAHIAGVEIANLSAAARRKGGVGMVGLVPVLFALPFNPKLALVQLYEPDTVALKRWDEESSAKVFGICGVDAHGWVDLPLNLRAWNVVLDAPLPLAPSERAAFILQEIGRGRFFCSAGLLGGPPRFRFFATQGEDETASVGESVLASRAQTLRVRANALSGADTSIVLLRNGEAILRTHRGELTYDKPPPGTYRVEIWMQVPNLLVGERQVPVIYSNRIQVVADPPLKAGTHSEAAP